MIELVIFDLDNVIMDGEAIDEIGKIGNVKDQIAEITEKAMQGEVDFETSIKERVKLLKGVSVDEIKELRNQIPLMDGAEETIKTLKDDGYKVIIISGSFDIIAEPLKEKLGVDDIFVNSLTEEDGKLTGEVTGDLVTKSKLDVLNDYIKDKDIKLENCVAIGDGANDISILEAVNLGIAFNAKPSVKEIADVVVDDKDLTAVLPIIEENKKSEDDFVLADTPEGVKQQKIDKEEEISAIADEREHFNRVAKEQRKIRDELNDELKVNLNKAIEYRDERNKINKEVENEKKLRNKANKEIRDLEWSSGKKDKIKIENEIKKIDKIIETRVLDIKKENQLVKNANDLRKQLMDIHEDEKVKTEAQELKKQSEEHHKNVVELSEKAQEAHEQMLKYFKKTDEIRAAADEAHQEFINARKSASAKHEEFKHVLSQIHIINKALGTSRPKRRNSNKKQNAPKRNMEEKEKAENLFDKFKHGKKLTTEELLLLQKYDIS